MSRLILIFQAAHTTCARVPRKRRHACQRISIKLRKHSTAQHGVYIPTVLRYVPRIFSQPWYYDRQWPKDRLLCALRTVANGQTTVCTAPISARDTSSPYLGRSLIPAASGSSGFPGRGGAPDRATDMALVTSDLRLDVISLR